MLLNHKDMSKEELTLFNNSVVLEFKIYTYRHKNTIYKHIKFLVKKVVVVVLYHIF